MGGRTARRAAQAEVRAWKKSEACSFWGGAAESIVEMLWQAPSNKMQLAGTEVLIKICTSHQTH